MEISLCTRLLSSTRVGINSSKIGSVPLALSPKRRGKHHDADKFNKFANLSTQSCLPEKNSAPTQENVQNKLLFPAFANVERHRHKIAISDVNGDYLYEDLYLRSWDLAQGIKDLLGHDVSSARVCLFCPGSMSHVMAVWATWMAGQVAVPLCPSTDQARVEHVIMDTKADLVITTVDQVSRVHNFTKAHGQKLIVLDETWWTEPKKVTDLEGDSSLPQSPVEPAMMKDSSAMIMYTAGMTGTPRGFVYVHSGLGEQIDLVANTWELAASDSVLHSLRLDSVYGAINSLQAPLASGARIKIVPVNDQMSLWSNILGVGLKSGKTLAKINLFPSIPNVYSSLIQSSAELFKDKKTKEYVKSACGKRVRLMVSSTSALSPSVLSQWKNVTGHKILDNFVSTETGTGLETKETQIVRYRDHTRAAHDVLAESAGNTTSIDTEEQEPVMGELRIKLQTDTRELKDGAEVTNTDDEKWFNTGDLVEFSGGSHRLWGKLNMTKIRHKGATIDTLNVEKKLLSNKDIDDCYVVGLGDVKENQQLAALIVLTKTKKVNIDSILEWCSTEMKEEEIPTIFKLVTNIHRDNSGHVDKIKLRPLFHEEDILCFHDCKL